MRFHKNINAQAVEGPARCWMVGVMVDHKKGLNKVKGDEGQCER